MLNPYVLFSNLFRSAAIIPERLYGFGIVVLQGLILANDKKQYDSIIETITAALTALKTEMSDVDTNLNDQKNETKTVDAFIAGFSAYLSDNEPFMARQLGGKESAGYLSFFPYGLSEYFNATKTGMPVLTSRVKKAAVKYSGKLDPEVAAALQAFDGDFEKQYGVQQTQIQTVNQDRTEQKSAFVDAQIALTISVYAVGMQYPGDVVKCASFFPFHMLYPAGQKTQYVLAGDVEKSGEKELLNYNLNPTALVVFENDGDNAAYAAWLAALPADPMPDDALEVNVGAAPITLVASKLGDLKKKPFLMVKNLSNVNSCSYQITIIGLRKPRKGESLPAELRVVMEEAV